ncbi:MAG: VWA domain-containing protein [Fuerstiella sp.]|nr:VWA domain-containing protein [Fuerstiella sp.]
MTGRLPVITVAQTATESFQTIEFSLPQSAAGMLGLIAGLIVLSGLTVRTSLKDSRFLRRGWRIALLIPRLVVLALLVVILVNPSRRTQTSRTEQSRVGVLVDTSLSMDYPSSVSAAQTAEQRLAEADPDDNHSRLAAVQQTLVDSDMLQQLSDTHAVSVYTFDSELTGPQVGLVNGEVRFADHLPDRKAEITDDLSDPPSWNRILTAQGSETRLGEALHEMIGRMAGRTLSGIIVVSDGQSNVGLDPALARQRAERSDTRIISVGVGSPKPQTNIWVAGVQAPADVHRGDPFDLTVIVQGNRAQPASGTVELYEQSADGDGSDRRHVEDRPFALNADGLPVPVRFSRQISVPGHYEFVAKVVLNDTSVRELTVEDNQRHCRVEVTDRRMNVLVISSGPMREYRFVRNTLYRHTGIDSDVWLQTVTDDNVGMVSQESRKLLTGFPVSAADLAKYNVIVAFDADWNRLSAEQRQFLNRWVHRDAGGLIAVAGELHTPQLALEADKLRDVSVLYPVVLNRLLADLRISQRADTASPVVLTPEGRASEFLKISDAAGQTSTDLWETFSGIYRSYPVRSVRDGAVVLARYANPRARTQDGDPPFLATQFYGAGRTFFVGSAETWRLRSISPEGHQRFWTSLIREAGQGSRQRGNPRGLLLVDRTASSPGQPITIQARLYDPRMEPLQTETVPVSIIDADGRPASVPDRLRSHVQGTGQFSAVFRPLRPGSYRVTVPVPDSADVLQTNLEVTLSNLESERSEQNVDLLKNLVRETGGRYLTLEECGEQLADLLPDRSERAVIDEQLTTLWDRSWLMYTMIALLTFEWLLRRIVRLS